MLDGWVINNSLVSVVDVLMLNSVVRHGSGLQGQGGNEHCVLLMLCCSTAGD